MVEALFSNLADVREVKARSLSLSDIPNVHRSHAGLFVSAELCNKIYSPLIFVVIHLAMKHEN